MTKQEIEQKIEQKKRDRAVIDANIAELEEQKAALEPRWMIAKNYKRVLLHLNQLSETAKDNLVDAIKQDAVWISFDITPNYWGWSGCFSTEDNGLKTYDKTEIVI